jgi:hypothetical protein
VTAFSGPGIPLKPAEVGWARARAFLSFGDGIVAAAGSANGVYAYTEITAPGVRAEPFCADVPGRVLAYLRSAFAPDDVLDVVHSDESLLITGTETDLRVPSRRVDGSLPNRIRTHDACPRATVEVGDLSDRVRRATRAAAKQGRDDRVVLQFSPGNRIGELTADATAPAPCDKLPPYHPPVVSLTRLAAAVAVVPSNVVELSTAVLTVRRSREISILLLRPVESTAPGVVRGEATWSAAALDEWDGSSDLAASLRTLVV